MQRRISTFMLFTICSIGIFGLFGGCKTDKDMSKTYSKNQRDKKKLEELFFPTSDKPAYEGFKGVNYASTIRGYKNRPELRLYYSEDVAVCELNKSPNPALHQLNADYEVDGDTILFDFKRDIEKKKNITFEEYKDILILTNEDTIEDLEIELNKPDTTEEDKDKLKKNIEMHKEKIRKFRAGEYDKMCTDVSNNLRKQMEELEKINPVKATVSSDKSKIVMEKFVVINGHDGTKKELENIELLKW